MSSSSLLTPVAASTLVEPPSAFDFVRSDFDALSSHMAQCSAAQGRWSAVRGGLQQAHAMAIGRIVTLAFIATAVTLALVTFA